MRADIFDVIAAVEDHHWWFQARKRIILSLLERELPRLAPGGAVERRILDVGAGGGMLASAMTHLGHVTAMEGAPEALPHLERRVGLTVIPRFLPSPDLSPESFDLVTSFDVLEHIEDDRAALHDLRQALKPGGALMVTVPTHPWMWSAHDEVGHHFRRYRPGEIEQRVMGAGFSILFSSPFQTLLFPLQVAERLARRWLGPPPEGEELRMPPRWVNWMAYQMFAFERHWIGRRWRAPIGSSQLVLARKPPA